jgi:hypothetical protein
MSNGSAFNDSIPAYRGTVFISYARADDERPPFDDATQGWVRFFWEQLRWELTDKGVHQAKLWLDRYEIEPAEEFTHKIDEALKEARLIIPVLSPNWVQRSWCRKEIDRFVELQSKNAPDGIVPVKKIETPEAALPEPLKNREGYKFFVKDPTGVTREFYWRGLQDKAAYFDVLKQIAQWIAQRLIEGGLPADATKASAGAVVYLAAPADELRDAWRRVANDLEDSGYVVLPSEGRLPDVADKADAAIRDALAKAVLFVQFLGESEGGTPDGSNETLVRLQLRLAREHSGAAGPIPRLLWVPKWLPGRRDSKRDPFEVLKRFGGLSSGEEIYAEEATDLSQWLRGWLKTHTPSTARIVSSLVVAAAASEDDGVVGMLANRLQSEEIKVKPLFGGDAVVIDDLNQATAVFVLWNNASRTAIETLLDALASTSARVTLLYLPGGDMAAKQRFFREGVYVELLEALPPDRRAARELLVRLEIETPRDGWSA